MASIPCAAYQASHIHAHLRRQEMAARRRHTSTASTDSTASDSQGAAPTTQPMVQLIPSQEMAPPATYPQLNNSPRIQNVGVRDQMDRVTAWIGDSFKKWRPGMAVNTTTMHPDKSGCMTDSVPTRSLTNQGHIIKSDT